MLISELLNPKRNSLDIFRTLAALMVIYGHSWAFTPGIPSTDIVWRVLGFDYSGSLAVKFFFMLSGLLVTASLIAKPNISEFVVKRIARLFPGLIVCLLISVLIIGAIFTQLSLKDYFSDIQTWRYLYNNIFLYNIEWFLPGVFSNSQYGVNGSLWTLPHEGLCYIFLAGFYLLRLWHFRWIANVGLLLVIYVSFFAPQHLLSFWSNNPESHLLPGCFALGALLATNQNRVPVNLLGVVLLGLLTAGFWATQYKLLVFYCCFFYLILYVASRSFVVAKLKLSADPSYGIYIYGFVVQQSLAHALPGQGILFNQLAAAVIALSLGLMSWYWVEKPAIQWAKNFSISPLLRFVKARL